MTHEDIRAYISKIDITKIDITPFLSVVPKARKNEEWIFVPSGEAARRHRDYLVSVNPPQCLKLSRTHLVSDNDWKTCFIAMYMRKIRKKIV